MVPPWFRRFVNLFGNTTSVFPALLLAIGTIGVVFVGFGLNKYHLMDPELTPVKPSTLDVFTLESHPLDSENDDLSDKNRFVLLRENVFGAGAKKMTGDFLERKDEFWLDSDSGLKTLDNLGTKIDAKRNEKRSFKNSEYVLTWVTQGTLNLVVRYLPRLMHQFTGPIQLTIFLTGAYGFEHEMLGSFLEFAQTCLPVDRLQLHVACDRRRCKDLEDFLIGDFQDIANFSPSERNLDPGNINKGETDFCKEMEENLLRFAGNYNSNFEHDVGFPANFLRNLGLRRVSSEFVLVADIDLIPSRGLYEKVARFLLAKTDTSIEENSEFLDPGNGETTGSSSKSHSEIKPDEKSAFFAFVIPVFEQIDNGTSILDTTNNVNGLLHGLKSGDVRIFYSAICPLCQASTNYKRWFHLSFSDPAETEDIEAYSTEPWHDPYEPFFVAKTRKAPRFDERFVQYGKNRLSQLCEMHLAGFELMVLTRVYLVHDGFKDTLSAGRQQELKRSKMMFQQFKQRVYDKYPESDRRC